MRMRIITSSLLLVLLVGLAACSSAESGDGGDSAEGPAAVTTTRADPTTSAAPTTTARPVLPSATEATELADAWVAGWDAKDPEAVAAVFTEDGVYVDTVGVVYPGVESIMREVRASPAPGAPARITDLTRWGDSYRFGTRFGWSGSTWVGDVEMQFGGELASRLAWVGPLESYRGTHEQLFDAEYTGLAEVASDATCEEGLIPAQIVVWGTEAALGSFQATAHHCTDPEAGRVLDGELVITTADGDELHGTYSGHITATNPDGSMDLQLIQKYKGGTGRFVNAIGEADEPCNVRYFTETQSMVNGSLKGTLTYDAAS